MRPILAGRRRAPRERDGLRACAMQPGHARRGHFTRCDYDAVPGACASSTAELLSTRSGSPSLLRSVRQALRSTFRRKRQPVPPVGLALRGSAFNGAAGLPWPQPGVSQPSLGRCLFLALLLHILLFIVVGTAPGGDSPASKRTAGDLVVYMPENRESRAAEARTAQAAGAEGLTLPPESASSATAPSEPASAAANQTVADAAEFTAIVEPSIVIRDKPAPTPAPRPAPTPTPSPTEAPPATLPLLTARKAPVSASEPGAGRASAPACRG
jgi:hypothetical protein